MAIAHFGEAGRHGGHGEVVGLHVGQLFPGQRCRHGRAGLRPHAVGRGDRPIARVLVVVDEDALASLLLPPLRGHLSGQAPLQFAPERDRRVADVGERPPRLDAHVDVHAAAAGGLGEAGVAELVEQRVCLGRDAHRVVEVGPRLRVEVDPQLVGVIDILAAHGPGMEGDGAHLRGPADDRQLGRTHLVGVTARRELDPRRLHIVRCPLGDALLKERVTAATLARRHDHAGVYALGPALQRRRPPVERPHDAVADGQVVAHELELGDGARALRGREDHAIGVGDPQIAPAGVNHRRLGGGHARKFYGKFAHKTAADRKTTCAAARVPPERGPAAPACESATDSRTRGR